MTKTAPAAPPASETGHRSGALAPFASRDFRTLWSATVASNFGGMVQAVAAAWMMTQLTTSPTLIALVQASNTLPIMIFALISGALADLFDRRALMLAAQGLIDVIIPRGGKGLVGRVQAEARVPVFAHLEGVCHVYADGAADLAKARRVVLNAKTRRTGICGAAECLLIDREFCARHGDVLIEDLLAAGIEVRAEGALADILGTVPAQADDFGREFLAPIIAVRLVDGIEGAIAHIRRHGSGHTESVLTEDAAVAARFLAELDSAILMHNASTQFADGGEFGMGAEIGIATGKMHARGPVGAEQLTSFKYLVTGDGAVRPA